MNYKIIKNDANYNLDDLTKLLNTSYWAKDRKRETVKKTVENSLCYFAYDTDKNKEILINKCSETCDNCDFIWSN